MTTGADQLADDYRQLRQTIAKYPAITISESVGQSPDYYEIEYHLQGFARNPDGSITTTDLHKIEIKLPFGYPHFPPTVKPLTHIFHPDIDPAAIRIADHWQKNPDLGELVITIGKMICGEIYSTKDPFNQEAAAWYKQQQGQLPLDKLRITDIESPEKTLASQDEEPGDGEDFFSLGLDDDDFFDEVTDDSYDEQINLLRLQIEQKNIFAASGVMGNIPQSVQFANREYIARTIAKALQQSDKLFKQAETLENQGSYNDAAAIIEKLTEIAADTPGLDNFRNRIKSSGSLADNFDIAQLEDQENQQPSDDIPSPPPPETTETTRKSLKGKEKKFTVPIKSIAAILILVILSGVGAIIYMKDKSILSQSINEIERINHLIRKRQLFDARAEAEAALRLLSEIKFLQTDADDMAARLKTLMESEEFIQGLQGKILYNGEFVSLGKADRLKTLEQITSQAVSLVKQGRITKALSEYRKALAYANKHELVVQTRQIEQTINNLSFTEAMVKAGKAEQAKEWKNAADTYRRALELSRDISDPAEAAKISKLLTAATFRHGMDQSKQKFTARQWQETIATIEQAKQLIENNPAAVTPQEKAELNKLLLNSKLHQILTHAREAYEKRDWQQANNYYTDSLKFIDRHQNYFGRDGKGSSIEIRRTMLMIKISRENESAGLAEHKNDHKTTLKHYDNILKLIQASGFKEEDKLVDIGKNIQKRRMDIQEKVNMQTRISWLENNFQEIFKKHYPAFSGSILANPRAKFIKDIGTKKIFTLSCSEGHSSRLELQYAYDRQTGKWSLYTGQ